MLRKLVLFLLVIGEIFIFVRPSYLLSQEQTPEQAAALEAKERKEAVRQNPDIIKYILSKPNRDGNIDTVLKSTKPPIPSLPNFPTFNNVLCKGFAVQMSLTLPSYDCDSVIKASGGRLTSDYLNRLSTFSDYQLFPLCNDEACKKKWGGRFDFAGQSTKGNPCDRKNPSNIKEKITCLMEVSRSMDRNNGFYTKCRDIAKDKANGGNLSTFANQDGTAKEWGSFYDDKCTSILPADQKAAGKAADFFEQKTKVAQDYALAAQAQANYVCMYYRELPEAKDVAMPECAGDTGIVAALAPTSDAAPFLDAVRKGYAAQYKKAADDKKAKEDEAKKKAQGAGTAPGMSGGQAGGLGKGGHGEVKCDVKKFDEEIKELKEKLNKAVAIADADETRALTLKLDNQNALRDSALHACTQEGIDDYGVDGPGNKELVCPVLSDIFECNKVSLENTQALIGSPQFKEKLKETCMELIRTKRSSGEKIEDPCQYILDHRSDYEKEYKYIEKFNSAKAAPLTEVGLVDLLQSYGKIRKETVSRDLGLFVISQKMSAVIELQASLDPAKFLDPKNDSDFVENLISNKYRACTAIGDRQNDENNLRWVLKNKLTEIRKGLSQAGLPGKLTDYRQNVNSGIIKSAQLVGEKRKLISDIGQHVNNIGCSQKKAIDPPNVPKFKTDRNKFTELESHQIQLIFDREYKKAPKFPDIPIIPTSKKSEDLIKYQQEKEAYKIAMDQHREATEKYNAEKDEERAKLVKEPCMYLNSLLVETEKSYNEIKKNVGLLNLPHESKKSRSGGSCVLENARTASEVAAAAIQVSILGFFVDSGSVGCLRPMDYADAIAEAKTPEEKNNLIAKGTAKMIEDEEHYLGSDACTKVNEIGRRAANDANTVRQFYQCKGPECESKKSTDFRCINAICDEAKDDGPALCEIYRENAGRKQKEAMIDTGKNVAMMAITVATMGTGSLAVAGAGAGFKLIAATSAAILSGSFAVSGTLSFLDGQEKAKATQSNCRTGTGTFNGSECTQAYIETGDTAIRAMIAEQAFNVIFAAADLSALGKAYQEYKAISTLKNELKAMRGAASAAQIAAKEAQIAEKELEAVHEAARIMEQKLLAKAEKTTTQNMKILEDGIAALKNAKPIDEAKLKELEGALAVAKSRRQAEGLVLGIDIAEAEKDIAKLKRQGAKPETIEALEKELANDKWLVEAVKKRGLDEIVKLETIANKAKAITEGKSDTVKKKVAEIMKKLRERLMKALKDPKCSVK